MCLALNVLFLNKLAVSKEHNYLCSYIGIHLVVLVSPLGKELESYWKKNTLTYNRLTQQRSCSLNRDTVFNITVASLA